MRQERGPLLDALLSAFFSSRRRHTRYWRDWSSDVCSSDLTQILDESTWDSPDAPQYPGGLHYADDKINAFLQGSTQYDGLGHVWYGGKNLKGSYAPPPPRAPRKAPL